MTKETDILIGDTIGEMGLYLQLTSIAFVGRSLSAEGGKPLEPAVLGCAIISGNAVQNFRVAYQLLVDANAACLVSSPEALKNIALFIGASTTRQTDGSRWARNSCIHGRGFGIDY